MNASEKPLTSNPTEDTMGTPSSDKKRQGLLSAAADSNALDIPLAWVVTVAPALGFLTGIFLLWGEGIGPYEISVFLVLYVLTLLGVEAGFHRLFSHGSFRCKPAVRAVFAILGSMSFQGPVIWWAAVHRIHHAHSDQPGDPHSPHTHGGGITGTFKGLFHAHFGWLFQPDSIRPKAWARQAPDLFRDRILYRIHCQYFLWLFAGFLLPTIILGVLHGTWKGAFMGFLWGGLIRIFAVNHTIWSVNSICHFSGRRPWNTKDHSRNNAALALPSMGASWHNNHHAFPSSAVSGMKWWQLDLSGLTILMLQRLGLVWEVNVPTERAIEFQVKATEESR